MGPLPLFNKIAVFIGRVCAELFRFRSIVARSGSVFRCVVSRSDSFLKLNFINCSFGCVHCAGVAGSIRAYVVRSGTRFNGFFGYLVKIFQRFYLYRECLLYSEKSFVGEISFIYIV